jgi:hypothetical protein
VESSTPAKRTESVPFDWRVPLSPSKLQFYSSILRSLETGYAMFSISLDEAIGLRRQGRLAKAAQILAVAPSLCQKLSLPLTALLRSMNEHARRFGTAPSLAALDPENFQSSKGQRVARYNEILSHVLLTRRSQFLHKISALADLVEELSRSFSSSAEELESGCPHHPDRCWAKLDQAHYDLNTCLRESIVLLKCFLLALPEMQLPEFLSTLHREAHPLAPRPLSEMRHLAHRRLAPIKGQ